MQGFTYKYGDRPLEGYTIQRAAGRGGFGEVYYALSDSGREVALKVVQGYEAIELRGISQCMNLKSPHLVTIFDVKYNEAGKPFVLMEYVAGPSLRQLIDESPAGLGSQKTAFFLREMAKGLTYLHDRGIVHRDLKPGNVFYEDGYVKIGDYGLSKAMSASRHSGQTITVGTVHYMAPEIGQGNYDRSIDIYALGCMVYEMLTGQTPYLGASPGEILMKHMMEQPDLSNIEEPFATVIRRALAKDPKERFQTVQEMVEAVFGAAHIQQSVSCFSPESLTMVAGRVAQKVIAGGPGSSGPVMGQGGAGAAADNEQGEWIDRFGQRMERVEQRIEAAGERLGQKLQQAADKVRQKVQGKGGQVPLAAPPQTAPTIPQELDVDLKRDPLNTAQRRLLGLASGVAVALGAGFVAGQTSWGGSPDGALLAPLAPFLAILLGMSLAWPQLGKSLAMESRIVRRLAFGGIAGVFALLACYGGLLMGQELGMKPFAGRYFPGTVVAIIVPLFLMDWTRIMNPARRQRISLGHAIWAGLLGLVLGAILDGVAPVVMGALCAASLGVQAAFPYDPLARRSKSPRTVKVQADLEFELGSQDRGQLRQERSEERALRAEARQQRHEQRAQRAYPWSALPPAGVWTQAGYRSLPPGVSPTKRVWALLLAAAGLAWVGGLHRFYVGKIWTGLLWLCTAGLFGVGQLIDAIMILSGNFRDKHGRRLVVWADYNEVPSAAAAGAPGWQQSPASPPQPTPVAPAAPAAAVAPAATEPQVATPDDGSAAGIRPLSMPSWHSQSSYPRRGFASPVLGFFGGLLLFVTLVLGVAAGLVVPGMFALMASSPTSDLEWLCDILCDTRSFDMISSAAMVLAGGLVLGAASLLVVARRWAGGVHQLRATLGCGGLLLSVYAFWATVVPGSYHLAAALTEAKQQNVQATVQALGRGLEPAGHVMAGLLLLGSIVLLAWPPRQPKEVPAPVGKGV